MRIPLAIGAAMLAASVAFATAPAHAADPGAPGPIDGTITINATAAAAGVGYTWGHGTLMFHHHAYRFSVKGISIADVGYAHVYGRGRVYGLHKLSDFTGTYAAATGEATLVNGVGGQVLRNGNGVQIRVDQITRGARLDGSADGIQLTLD
jgi:hypothetical protein